MDYKDTINLPGDSLPMKANLAQREPDMLKQWHDQDWYGLLQHETSDRPAFILHDGPPYANGDIHIGHAVNKILKDMVMRSRMLSGFRTPYVPGWDCHGLPIELQVEKKVGKVGHKVDAREFRQRCRDYAAQQIERQSRDFQRLGILGDWANRYASSDFSYEADMLRALAQIIDNGYLQQGVKPVHWCFDCGSALAEAEIEYQDKTSPAIDVLFTAVQPEALLALFDVVAKDDALVGLPIWTTTPWTIPANQAVAVHAQLDYQLISARQTTTAAERSLYLVVADALVDAVVARCELQQVQRLGTVSGQQLEHVQLKHPLYERQVPVILGEHVTTEQGTGAVHTAPGHGQEDFQVGQQYGLEVLCPVADNGVFSADTGVVGGQHIWKANAMLVEAMHDNGTLLAQAAFQHSYPHCWRHKTPTAFRVTPQWFIAMDQPSVQGNTPRAQDKTLREQGKTLREQALAAIEQVRWVPDWGQARIHGMVENRPDWCISRQRTWGVPIPLLIHKQTGALHPDTSALVRQVADLVAQEGIDAWYEDDIVTRLGQDAETWQPVQDILDVWFDSGSSHFAVLEQRPELQRPADLYLEGSDQHRGWFQTSLLNSVAMYGEAPYRQVLTHGFTVDADGRKMSKSLGNVIAPQQVMNTLGADILRLWVSAADYRQEMTVSDEILKRIGDAYRRIRNTSRFLLGNVADFTAEHLLPPEQMLPLDRWAVDRARQTQQQIIQAYDDYQFHNVYQRMHQFCIVDMGGFYLDVIKDRLYTMPRDSVGRRSAQTAMWHMQEAMVRWMAPILCFTAEEIWQSMAGERSRTVQLQTWYDGLDEFSIGAQEQARWQVILQLRDPLRKRIETLRREQNIGNSLAYQVDLYADGELLKMLREMADELHFLFITAKVNVHAMADADNSDAMQRVELEGGHLLLQIAPSKAARCVRCWHHDSSVGSSADHPEICSRCHSNVCGDGETRRWG